MAVLKALIAHAALASALAFQPPAYRDSTTMASLSTVKSAKCGMQLQRFSASDRLTTLTKQDIKPNNKLNNKPNNKPSLRNKLAIALLILPLIRPSFCNACAIINPSMVSTAMPDVWLIHGKSALLPAHRHATFLLVAWSFVMVALLRAAGDGYLHLLQLVANIRFGARTRRQVGTTKQSDWRTYIQTLTNSIVPTKRTKATTQANQAAEVNARQRATRHFQDKQFEQHHHIIHVRDQTTHPTPTSTYLNALARYSTQPTNPHQLDYLQTLSKPPVSSWSEYKNKVTEWRAPDKQENIQTKEMTQLTPSTTVQAQISKIDAQNTESQTQNVKSNLQEPEIDQQLEEFDKKSKEYEESIKEAKKTALPTLEERKTFNWFA